VVLSGFPIIMTEESKTLTPEEREKCQRWRKIAIDQLSYALNLTLTFAVAALGFCFALLRDKDFVPVSCAKYTMILALLGFGASAIFAYWCVLTRLKDFRETARRACNHPEKLAKEEVRELDKRTLYFFEGVVSTFGLGVVSLAATLLMTFGAKLFP
jgi:hypothetical protein